MHLKYLLFWGILCILITGCQSEPTELNLQATHKPSNGYTTRVLSVEEAYDNALPLINQVCSEKSIAIDFSLNRGEKVETIGLPGFTRSSSLDSLMYVINFDDQGFAIVGSNPNGRPLYAFSETGHFNISDTTYCQGLKYLIDGSIAAAYKERITPARTETRADSIKYTLYRNIQPLLPPKVAIWHQRTPYNNACPICELGQGGGNVPQEPFFSRGVVGCAPLSIGMLLAYYQWPDSIDSVILNWKGIREGTDRIQIGFLLQKIAELAGSQYTDTTMTDRQTHQNNFMVPFRSLGASLAGAYKGLDFQETANRDNVLNFLAGEIEFFRAAPVMVSSIFFADKPRGHVWVLDGYFEFKCSSVDSPNKKLPNELYLHCIWGLPSLASNGYYFYNTETGKVDSTSVGPNDDPIGSNATLLRIYGKIRIPNAMTF